MNPALRSRRSFIQELALGAVAAPWVTSGLMAQSPNGKIRHASFGCAGMAMSDLNGFSGHKLVEIVAGCDVDEKRTAEFRKKWPNARVYADYRELLEKEKDLQSVNVSTPDHMHAPIGLNAIARGLAIYGQKPLANTIAECRQLAAAAQEKKVVTQMGIQIHSSKEYRTAVAAIQAGIIGKIRQVHTWSFKDWGDRGAMPAKTDPVPDGLNWDLWLGVCAERPFIGGGWYHPGNWRKRLDFGTGTFGDMGCHVYDPVYNALALTAPISVRSVGEQPNAHSWALDEKVHYIYPGTAFTAGPTVEVIWYDGKQTLPENLTASVLAAEPVKEGKTPKLEQTGSIFIGEKGTMYLPHIGMPRLIGDGVKDAKIQTIEGVNHWHTFLDAVAGNGKTSAHFDYAAGMTSAVLLGGIATRFKDITLEWDDKVMKFKQDAANPFVRRTYRAGWKV